MFNIGITSTFSTMSSQALIDSTSSLQTKALSSSPFTEVTDIKSPIPHCSISSSSLCLELFNPVITVESASEAINIRITKLRYDFLPFLIFPRIIVSNSLIKHHLTYHCIDESQALTWISRSLISAPLSQYGFKLSSPTIFPSSR